MMIASQPMAMSFIIPLGTICESFLLVCLFVFAAVTHLEFCLFYDIYFYS